MRSALLNSKRIVIKVGTSSLTYENGNINFSKIEKLVRTISDLVNQDKEIILVSSGAIGVGVGKLRLRSKPKTLGEKQAVAAVGQCELMHIYSKIFSEYGHIVGQVLLTKDVVEDKIRKKNVINTFNNLLIRKIVPIVNENDTISVEEIANLVNFGDNDTLSATVSSIVQADLLIILSDVDGLYSCDPRCNKESKLIHTVTDITPKIEKCAGDAGTSRGTGGMTTKIRAAKTATENGVNMVLANSEEPAIILDILKGKNIGTLFLRK